MVTVFGALEIPKDAEELITQYMGSGPDGHPVSDPRDIHTALSLGNDYRLARRDQGEN